MQLRVNREKKTAEIWVTNSEQQHPAFRKVVLPYFLNQFKPFNYSVTVYYSGQKDLEEQTSALLCYNRRRLAQLETERESAILS